MYTEFLTVLHVPNIYDNMKLVYMHIFIPSGESSTPDTSTPVEGKQANKYTMVTIMGSCESMH